MKRRFLASVDKDIKWKAVTITLPECHQRAGNCEHDPHCMSQARTFLVNKIAASLVTSQVLCSPLSESAVLCLVPVR